LCIEPLARESADEAGRTPLELPAGAALGLSFRHGHYKCMFSTTVAGALRIALSADLRVDALLIRRPDTIQQLQRRAFNRVAVPRGTLIPADLSPIADRPDAPRPSNAAGLCGYVSDLSAGGVRLRLAALPGWSPGVGDAFRIVIRLPRRAPIELTGLYRHCHLDPAGEVHWGFQTCGPDPSGRGRETLTSIHDLVQSLARGRPV
jgi:hypothetical protein